MPDDLTIAVIPARGGSKRIPGKNIKPFAGRPIIGYSIAAAREAGLFDRVVVSTDDPETAEAAQHLGAEAPFLRPAELADDHTGTNAVVRHALMWFMEQGEIPAYTCCIYATAPFLQARYLREGWERLRASGKSFVFSVTGFSFPIQRALRLGSNGEVEPFFPEYAPSRSQDLPEAYHDAGQFYWGTAQAFLEQVPMYAKRSLGLVLPRYLVQDIDTPEDWTQAELMYQALRGALERTEHG